MKTRKIIAYRLQPVYEVEPGTIATAAIMQCMATGEMLSGMGGGGDFLSPKVVEMLRGGGCTITKDEEPKAPTPGKRGAANFPLELVISAYLGVFPEETEALKPLVTQLYIDGDSILQRGNMSGHITSSMFILNEACDSALLIHHAQLGKWLQPGGHHEGQGSLKDNAFRELTEETGISRIKFLKVGNNNSIPLDIDTHDIPARPSKGEGNHQHHDFVFLARCKGKARIKIAPNEVLEARWVPLTEILTFEDARLRRLAQKTIDILQQV